MSVWMPGPCVSSLLGEKWKGGQRRVLQLSLSYKASWHRSEVIAPLTLHCMSYAGRSHRALGNSTWPVRARVHTSWSQPASGHVLARLSGEVRKGHLRTSLAVHCLRLRSQRRASGFSAWSGNRNALATTKIPCHSKD